jgi:RNA polymerase sigma-70 factor, ECF subfamily
MDEQSDDILHTLFVRASQGDSDAFEQLYRELYTPVFRYIFRRLRHEQTAEDMAQTVFLNFFRKIQTLRTDNPRAYCFVAAKHALTDHWKKRKDLPLEGEGAGHLEIPDLSQDPTLGVIHSEQSRFIDQAMKELTPLQQEIIELSFFHQLSYAEISEVTGKQEGAIRQHRCRALKALRVHFQSQEDI